MNCPKCGVQNMDGVTFCGHCGAQIESHQQSSQQSQQQQTQQPVQSYAAGGQPGGYTAVYTTPADGPSSGGMVPPKNYMTESIVMTVISFLCCCSPISVILGIIAIVKANNVNSEFARGNMNGAISNADSAKILCIWAAVISVVFYIICMIFTFWAVIISDSGFENFLNM
jgi:uncharacterized membrane protein YvbJ